MAYGDFEGVPRRPAASIKVYKFFDKKTSGGAVKSRIIQNKELAK